MRFLMLIHEDPASSAAAGPPPAELMRAAEAFRADTTNGRWVDDGGLASSADAIWLRTTGGRSSVLDGPFAETTEVVGGFFVVESPSAEHMACWARAFLAMHSTHWPQLSFTAEVRQIVGPE